MNGVASHVNDMEVERPDGTKTLLEIFGAPVTDDQGRIWASLVSFFDITERKRFEDDLHKSSELFRSLSTELQLILDASPVGICLLKNRKVVRANVAFESMFGYETGTTDTMDTAVLYSSKELYENTGAEAYQLLEGGGSYAKDVLMKKKDGTLFWCTISGHAIKPGNLEEGSIWIIQDISERKQSEERMLILSQRLQLATSSARLGIWDWNVVDNQMVWNDRMFELYGVTPDTFPSNIDAWLNGLHPEDKVSALAECQAALNGDREFNTEFRVLHPDGAVRHLKANAIVMRGADGRAERMTGINADITESRHTEKELIQATAAAESASRIKSQFLANMSHEIRTPMNGIIAISQLLQMTELTEEQREYADLIKSSGNNLVKLLSDILDLSRIEAGSVELEVQDFDLSIELQSTTAVFSLLAKGKGLEFIFDICPDVPLLLSGDIERLRQIITNLVGNAIKFSTEGTVSLHITKDEEDEKFTSLRFLVRDSGIGIARNNVGNIFEAFVQADSSTSIKYGGTGLGLSIARHLVELMGGSIGVESLEGQGSTFWFTAVFQKQADTRGIPAIETAVEAHTTTSAIRILLVEDDPANQFAFNRLLSKSDHQVEIAENGLEALKLLEEKDFDVVLMDCRMPVMDGYEATAAIRAPASRVRNRAIPIIALTANAMREDRDRCIAAGMDDYLSKPIELPVLLAMLGRWVTPQYYS
jgi:PAS domain S-box-containing protein